VAFFLAGLVVLGGLQQLVAAAALTGMEPLALFFGATALTAITDNAALTYLGSLVEGVSDEFKYALVAGAVAGGGLTVIANAPNPAGVAILQSDTSTTRPSTRSALLGAPIDVLATADGETMDKAVERKLVAPATRRDFAANTLVMVTPADSALGLTALADLTQPAVKRIALGNPAGVPAGRYAQGALQQAGLWPLPTGKAVYAQSVRQALDYVARGEVEAGFVYATDARMHADKVKVALDAPTDQAIIYPLAVTRDSRNKDSAAAFIAFVMSAKGQAVLARFGLQGALKPWTPPGPPCCCR
jgi:molybdate transport system substrate-binding protein